MTFLLDTNAWAAYLNRRDSAVARRVEQLDPSELVLCSVVKAELYFGAYKSPRRQTNLALLAKLFDGISSIPFDDLAADRYGQIRAALASRGTPIGPNDLMIAAIALAHDLTLVTHNVDEFERVAELKLEDWEA